MTRLQTKLLFLTFTSEEFEDWKKEDLANQLSNWENTLNRQIKNYLLLLSKEPSLHLHVYLEVTRRINI
jgi:hypothetical protein